MRHCLDEYTRTRSPDGYEALIHAAELHTAEYPGACDYILCCPALNKRTSDPSFAGPFLTASSTSCTRPAVMTT